MILIDSYVEHRQRPAKRGIILLSIISTYTCISWIYNFYSKSNDLKGSAHDFAQVITAPMLQMDWHFMGSLDEGNSIFPSSCFVCVFDDNL